MAFQKTVRLVSGLGVPGEILLHGPKRAGAYVLNGGSGDLGNQIGVPYIFNRDGTVGAGAKGQFAGFLANPKVYPLRGPLSSDDNQNRMSVPDGSVGEFLTMGLMLVEVANAAAIGDYVAFNRDTYQLRAVSNPYDGTVPTPPSGYDLVPNCFIDRFPQTNTSGGLVVIRLTN